jgi:small-conductance mechanosensitive channel
MDTSSDFLAQIWANDLYRKLVLSLAVIIAAAVLRYVIRRAVLERYKGEKVQVYTLGKIIDYLTLALAIILLFGIWIQRATDLTVGLGLVAAGLAFALQEVIGSIAGWLSIIFGKPFSLGDRIESGGIHGDVVDIGVLRTTLMETGNWLGGLQNTGRIVTLSNAFIFKEPLFNYSRMTRYVWDEVRVSIPYGEKWEEAKSIMLGSVNDHPHYEALVPEAERQNAAARRALAVDLSPLTPRTFVSLADSWIEVAVIYPVAVAGRRSFRSDISESILRGLAKAGIPVAFPTMTVEMARQEFNN